MRSDTARFGGAVRWGAGEGRKAGRVGTQGASHIDNGECLWIL
jgi:hypothetical protein